MDSISDHKNEILFGRPVDDFLTDGVPVFTEYAVEDSDLEYSIEVYIPGFKKPELRLNIQDDLLVLKAFRFQKEKGRWLTSTYRELVFRRSFVCPPDIASNTIKAVYLHGVLSIKLPKQLVSHSSKHPFFKKDRRVKIRGEKLRILKRLRKALRL